jgi:iron(III) transport system substrate-binding protein
MKAIISLALAFDVMFRLAGIIYAQSQSTERAKLIEDAKKEGKVMVYVSSNASDAKALKAAFEKKYPFINMEFLSSGKDALLSKYLLEVRTGTYLADVYQSSVFPIMNLLEKGLLARGHQATTE